MLYRQVRRLLEAQKKRMLELDGGSPDTGWLTEREQSKYDFSYFDDMKGRRVGVMEILYDNTIDWITKNHRAPVFQLEALAMDHAGLLSEDTTSASNIATLTTSLLPAVRRIYANLVAMDLVSTQPLKGPSGYVFWLDHHYHTTHAADGITADDRLDEVQTSKTYTDSSEQGTIREVNFKLTEKLIETEAKKVKADWTLEAQQDMMSQWGLDLEGEVLPELGNLITREINNKVIYALRQGVKNNTTWDPTPPAGDTATSDKNAYAQTLYHSIALANSKIYQEKFMNASWLIMNGNTYYYFQKLENFKSDAHALNQMSAMSVNYVGNLNGLYKVYVDPNFPDDLIMMGVRGRSWKEAIGYFSPYIPLFFSDKYIANDDFSQLVRGAMSRYAYGVIPETATQSPIKNGGLATVTISSS